MTRHITWKTHLLIARTTVALLLALPFSSPLHSQTSSDAQKPYYLHANDTVVFYGDSITEQRYYTQMIAVYTTTRFPSLPVTFYNEGIGGDRVTGGGGGPIDLRLTRDVFPQKPSVVTIMLGMNDGGYRALTPEIESQYTQGYEHILESIHKNLPGTRLTLLGPSPYDEVTRPEKFPGGYNATLVHFAKLDADLAKKHKATFIDLNAPFVESLKTGQGLMPTATQMLIPDRVHPEQLAHWFMAAAVLKGWNAPSLVSSVSIDAASAKALDQQRARVSALTASNGTLSWTELDEALPLPVDTENHAGYHFLRELNTFIDDLDQQPLKIEHLKPGTYQLTIDDNPVAKFTSDELSHGVNLALYGTPMRGQAYSVSWLIRDRDDAHYVRLRMLVNQWKTGVNAEPGATDLTHFEDILQTRIYDEAQPRPHNFRITPTTPDAK